jgi:hypothetical protein
MAKIFSLLLSMMIGKISGGDPQFLTRLPMLMVRKVVKQFFLGFAGLSIGVIGVGYMLREIISQLSLQEGIHLSSVLLLTILTAVCGFTACFMALRKAAWTSSEDLQVVQVSAPVQATAPGAGTSDLVQVLTALAMEYMEERRLKKSMQTPMYQPMPQDYVMNKEMHYDQSIQ